MVSGVRNLDNLTSIDTSGITPERYLDYFCPKCWSFEDFRHNKDAVRDWSFMRASIEKGNKIGERPNPSGLRGPLTDSEMQKVADLYLKIGKAQDPIISKWNLYKRCHPNIYELSNYDLTRYYPKANQELRPQKRK